MYFMFTCWTRDGDQHLRRPVRRSCSRLVKLLITISAALRWCFDQLTVLNCCTAVT